MYVVVACHQWSIYCHDPEVNASSVIYMVSCLHSECVIRDPFAMMTPQWMYYQRSICCHDSAVNVCHQWSICYDDFIVNVPPVIHSMAWHIYHHFYCINMYIRCNLCEETWLVSHVQWKYNLLSSLYLPEACPANMQCNDYITYLHWNIR